MRRLQEGTGRRTRLGWACSSTARSCSANTHKNSDETQSCKITRTSEERNTCSDSLGRSIELYSRATGNYSYSAWLVQSRHEMAPLILSLRLKSLTSNYSQSLTLLLSVTVTATVSSNDDKQRTNELWLILKVL